MKYPVFIFHELMLRLSEISPEIGTYDSSLFRDDLFIIYSTNGQITVDGETIEKQYQNPKLLSRADLDLLAQRFQTTAKHALAFG